jgi:inner membrane transporter RhtA
VSRLDRGLSGLGVGLALGSLVIAPFGLSGSGRLLHHGDLLLQCVLVGALSSAVGYGIDQAVMRRIPTRRFAVMLALLPVTAMAVGFLALAQVPSVLDLIGAALVVTGVVTQERDDWCWRSKTPA